MLLAMLLTGASALAAGSAPLALKTGTTTGVAAWQYWELTPDLSSAELAIAAKPGGAALLDLVPPGALAALNGGYFLKDYRPTGWVKDKSRELSKANTKSKRGGVLAVLGTQVFIGKLAELPFQPEFVVQNSPLLIEGDGSLGIRNDDGRRAPRTVACLASVPGSKVRHLSFILFAASNAQGPTLRETAELLALPRDKGGFGCGAALNLDGGPSTGAWFGPSLNAKAVPPPVPIGYAIVINPK